MTLPGELEPGAHKRCNELQLTVLGLCVCVCVCMQRGVRMWLTEVIALKDPSESVIRLA